MPLLHLSPNERPYKKQGSLLCSTKEYELALFFLSFLTKSNEKQYVILKRISSPYLFLKSLQKQTSSKRYYFLTAIGHHFILNHIPQVKQVCLFVCIMFFFFITRHTHRGKYRQRKMKKRHPKAHTRTENLNHLAS